MPLKSFIQFYEQKNLFLSISVRLRTFSHKWNKDLAIRAAYIRTGLFCFGHLSDSRANDRHLKWTPRGEAVGSDRGISVSRHAAATREWRNTDGTIRLDGLVYSIFLRCRTNLFFFVLYLKEKYVRELPISRV